MKVDVKADNMSGALGISSERAESIKAKMHKAVHDLADTERDTVTAADLMEFTLREVKPENDAEYLFIGILFEGSREHLEELYALGADKLNTNGSSVRIEIVGCGRDIDKKVVKDDASKDHIKTMIAMLQKLL